MSPNRELWLFVYFVCVPFCDTDLRKVVVNVGIATCEFSRYCQAYIQEGCASQHIANCISASHSFHVSISIWQFIHTCILYEMFFHIAISFSYVW